MSGVSFSSPHVSGLSRRRNRLLVEIGRIFKPTRSGTGSSVFASSLYAHASGQVLPLIRTLLKRLHHGLQARLRTFPDRLGDRGDRLLRFQGGQQESRVEVTLPRPESGRPWGPGRSPCVLGELPTLMSSLT